MGLLWASAWGSGSAYPWLNRWFREPRIVRRSKRQGTLPTNRVRLLMSVGGRDYSLRGSPEKTGHYGHAGRLGTTHMQACELLGPAESVREKSDSTTA